MSRYWSCRHCCSRADSGTDSGGIAVVPCRMAGFGFLAGTIPTQTSRINTITDIITIPVQADIMEDLTVAVITAAVLMAAVVADTAAIKTQEPT